MKAKFSINCEEIGFSRSHEMPLDARGYCHQLSEDLERAMQYYKIRVENHKLRSAMQEILDFHFFGDHSQKYRELLKDL